ncbi:MAG: hypothetical protein K2P81_15800 [Bacteriovoracaceae bacterium]|nr:hypothetical protein [Bacteriovoracaceae bacterium]
MKILVTGFEPFDGDSVNPSADFVNSLDSRFEKMILPVEFETCFKLIQERIEKLNPDYVIMFGLAKNRMEITLEKIGINWMDARIPDNRGYQPKAKKIVELGPDGIFTRLPIEKMIEKAGAGKISTTAGEYVCNYLMYRVLEANPNLKAGFIHLPIRPDFKILEAMIESCLQDG